jgi:hypothetical protein
MWFFIITDLPLFSHGVASLTRGIHKGSQSCVSIEDRNKNKKPSATLLCDLCDSFAQPCSDLCVKAGMASVFLLKSIRVFTDRGFILRSIAYIHFHEKHKAGFSGSPGNNFISCYRGDKTQITIYKRDCGH